jgi:hypothetical protein
MRADVDNINPFLQEVDRIRAAIVKYKPIKRSQADWKHASLAKLLEICERYDVEIDDMSKTVTIKIGNF